RRDEIDNRIEVDTKIGSRLNDKLCDRRNVVFREIRQEALDSFSIRFFESELLLICPAVLDGFGPAFHSGLAVGAVGFLRHVIARKTGGSRLRREIGAAFE